MSQDTRRIVRRREDTGKRARRSTSALEVGEVIKDYRIIGILGEGGIGRVYRAEHAILGHQVALKMLQAQFTSHPELVQRFLQEAMAASRVKHPGIVQVFGYGESSEGRAFLVMELLSGETLSQRIESRGRLPEEVTRRFLRQIARALAAAHAVGIVHRDLKPSNLMLVPDAEVEGGERVKVLDFGVAKLTSDDGIAPVQTRIGTLIGTPPYMAPEQCRGLSSIDHRADLYALGCIAFKMLCGRPPFVSDNAGDLTLMHVRDAAPSPRAFTPSVSPLLESIVLRLLMKDPAERYQSADDLVRALEPKTQDWVERKGVLAPAVQPPMGVPVLSTTLRAATGQAPHTTAPPMPTSTRFWVRVVLVTAMVSAAMIAIVLLVVGMRSNKSAPQPVTNALEPPSEGPLERMPRDDDGSNRWIRIEAPAAPVTLGLSAQTLADFPDASGFHPGRISSPRLPYEIQQHEVTFGEFEPWVRHHEDRTPYYPPAWLLQTPPEERREMPVTGVPWQTAQAYCQSLGAELPTEAQWEYAARGPEKRPYSGGARRADRADLHAYAGKRATTVAVMTRPSDRTPGDPDEAVHDLMGNAREWTADLWRASRDAEDDCWAIEDGIHRAIRGLPLGEPRPERWPAQGAAVRDVLCAEKCAPPPTAELADVGFRCVRPIEEPASAEPASPSHDDVAERKARCARPSREPTGSR